MRNAILPAVSSPLFNFGNNDVQMPNLDASMSMDSISSFSRNAHGSGFYSNSKVFNDGNNLRDGGFAIPYQSLVNYQLGYPSISSACNNISEQSTLLSKKVFVPEVQMDFQAMQMRKRSADIPSLFPQRSPSDLIENNTALDTWRTIKRQKVNPSEEQWHHQVKESISIQGQKFQVPARRSQKLSDKITALQKLVSPYGKTDTASVLQEASLYIKLLQEQIQNLFQMLTSAYNSARPSQHSQEIDGKLLDLRSRGLCLVPISFMQKMTLQANIDPNSCSRKSISARNL